MHHCTNAMYKIHFTLTLFDLSYYDRSVCSGMKNGGIFHINYLLCSKEMGKTNAANFIQIKIILDLF